MNATIRSETWLRQDLISQLHALRMVADAPGMSGEYRNGYLAGINAVLVAIGEAPQLQWRVIEPERIEA